MKKCHFRPKKSKFSSKILFFPLKTFLIKGLRVFSCARFIWLVLALSNGHSPANLSNSSTRQKIRQFWRIRVLAKMTILENRSDSIHSPEICQPFSPDSIHSPDIRQPFCSDSPDSQKASLATFRRIQQIWRVWRIQQVQTRPFYTYKLCYLCIKRPILLAPTFANLFWSDSIHSPDICQPFSPDSIHSPDIRQPFSPDSIHLQPFDIRHF